jgi:ABC-type lipoprotein export system ATPase subunit
MGMNAPAAAQPSLDAAVLGSEVPLLEVSDVHVDYGGVRALDGANLRVAAGEWVAVTGPSGSGKSTLLQLLGGLDRPTSGQIRFRGDDIASRGALDAYRREEVGFVFQLHHLLPHLDAARNVEVAMFGTRASRRERRERAMYLLSLVHLSGQAARRPPEMSGGERQRVAIARALANGPAVLLADEPTGSLDRRNAENVVAVFEELHRSRGMTLVMVTHDAGVADAADRWVTLVSGRVVGPP